MQASNAQLSGAPAKRRNWRSYWVRTMVQWHWISSAICLVGMILFAITGITLNHASQIEAQPLIQKTTGRLPTALLEDLRRQANSAAAPAADKAAPAVADRIADWVRAEMAVAAHGVPAEWSSDEVYVSMAGPGQDVWLAIDMSTGDVEAERTWRGWISYFNDLHKGRHTGLAWMWFLDIFSVATLVFCLTGLMLLVAHARRRKMTWPLVGLGLIVPALIAMLLIH